MKIQLSDHFTYKRLLRFCLPPIIMMIFTSIYTVVDGFFVSNFVGKYAFSSVNLIYPPINILGSLGFMIGAGGSALISKTLGEGDKEKANRYFSMLIIFSLILGITCSIIGLFLVKPISIALGATKQMLPDCILYGSVILCFNPLFMLQYEFQSFLAVAEKPKIGLCITMIAGLTNMLLDALFVAIFKWGVLGAALATGLSQCVGSLIPFIYFMRPNSSLLHLRKTKLEGRVLLKTCTNGSSEFVSNISGSIVSILFNKQLLFYAEENGVAAYGTIMYIQFIFISIYLGYTMGIAPIIAYHYGANNHKELKNLLKKSLILMSICGVSMFTIAFLFARPLSMIFVGYDTELLNLTTHALKLCSFAFLISGINIFASSFFTALNNGGVSATISFLRTLVFQCLSILILPLLFQLEGIWYTIALAEIFALIVSSLFLIIKKKKYNY